MKPSYGYMFPNGPYLYNGNQIHEVQYSYLNVPPPPPFVYFYLFGILLNFPQRRCFVNIYQNYQNYFNFKVHLATLCNVSIVIYEHPGIIYGSQIYACTFLSKPIWVKLIYLDSLICFEVMRLMPSASPYFTLVEPFINLDCLKRLCAN